MAEAASKFQPAYLVRRHEPTRLVRCGVWPAPILHRIVEIVAIAVLAIAQPSFAQRGGGGGMGGGSHGGGGGRVSGLGHSDVGGGHVTSGGGSRSPSVKGGNATKGGSIAAALRRFFGGSNSSSHPANTRAETRAMSSAATLVSRAVAQASLPPAFSHLRMNQAQVPIFEPTAGRTQQVRFLSMRSEVSAPPRPIGPPRRFYPIFFYGGYAPAFGFGFPFWGFDCFWFDCYAFNYDSYSAPWHYNGNPQSVMLLYLTSGAAREVTDYWVDGDTLRYIAQDGSEGEVRVSDVDVKRTSDANARVGFKFSLERTRRGMPLDRIEPPNSPGEPRPPES
jgi:hypothetical protein